MDVFVWFDCFLFCLIKLEASTVTGTQVHVHEAAALSVSLVANCVTPRLEPQLCGSQLCWCVLQELSWCFQPISGHNSVLLPRKGAKNKTQEKQVVLNTTAHHLLTDALPTPEQ